MAGRLLFLSALFTLGALAESWQPLSDHPRPIWARPWQNLNGPWKFDFDPNDIGLQEKWFESHTFAKQINVPFPWQSELSGIHDVDYNGVAWYEREISIPADAGPRIILTFGAIDWAATVWINGKEVVQHEGGYVPFSADITEHVTPGESARVTVRVVDNTDPDLPTGKQIGWYTRTGGIWQTVYLESRGPSEIRPVHIIPDIDAGTALFRVPIRAHAEGKYDVAIRAVCGDRVHTYRQSANLSQGDNTLGIELPVPDAALWTPDTPSLYETELQLLRDGEVMDVVQTYFGMRKVSRGTYGGSNHEYILLNNKPIYLRGALHQSFNPKGIYTHPDDAFIKRDYELAKSLGLNMIRIHIKVEEPRALYWADKLGILIMADTPNWWKKSDRSRKAWEETMLAQFERDFNHPSIFSWVLFNETWGIGDQGYDRNTQEWVREMYLKAKQLDPTRLIEDNSPCYYDHVQSDINSWHFYIDDFEKSRDHIQEVVDNTFPGSQFNYAEGWKQDTAPLMNSEYGGVSAGSGDRDISWVFLFLTNLLRKHEKCVGYVYTELSDIEWEHNGFVNYDRSPKLYNYPANITVADLQGAEFPVLDCPPYQIAKAGDSVSVPVSISHWSEQSGLVLRISVDGQTIDGKKWDQWVKPEERALDVPSYRVTPQSPFSFIAPPGEGLLNVIAEILQEGKRVAASYCVIHVKGGPIYDAPNQVALTFPVEDIADASPVASEPMSLPRAGKVYREGAGFFNYKLRLPKDLNPDAIVGAKLYVEVSAKAGIERLDWPARRNPQAYPQSDTKLWPTAISVSLNDLPLGVITYPTDPADARGVLSHVAAFHHGSYGGVYDLPFKEDALAALQVAAKSGKPFSLRFEVKPDAKYIGGLALYGESMGSWPSDPYLLLELADGSSKPVGKLETVDTVMSQLDVILPTGPDGHKWHYTTENPGEGWIDSGFKHAKWMTGKSGFGTEGTPNARIGTAWSTNDIWLRTTVKLPKDFGARGAWVALHHDEDVEVFVNGRPLLTRKGHVTGYQGIGLTEGQINLFEPGKKNVIAIHCKQTGGGQFIDLGLSSLGD